MEETGSEIPKPNPGPLESEGLDFHLLPDSFEITQDVNSGFDKMRAHTAQQNVEVGGVLLKDTEGKLEVATMGKGTSPSGVFVRTNILEDEESVQRLIEHHEHVKTDDTFQKYKELLSHDSYFVDSALAEKYKFFFQTLSQEGGHVILDARPLGKVHTHPSGNLPSRGDFSQVLSREGDETVREIVVTDEWAYFLFSTQQTPNLEPEQRLSYARQEPEDEILEHMNQRAASEGSESDSSKRNAIRLKTLQDDCGKYSIGFYALKKGDSKAHRVA